MRTLFTAGTHYFDDILTESAADYPFDDATPKITHELTEMKFDGGLTIGITLTWASLSKLLLGAAATAGVWPIAKKGAEKVAELAAEDLWKWFKRSACRIFGRTEEVASRAPQPFGFVDLKDKSTLLAVRGQESEPGSKLRVLHIRFTADPERAGKDSDWVNELRPFELVYAPTVVALIEQERPDSIVSDIMIRASLGPENNGGWQMMYDRTQEGRTTTVVLPEYFRDGTCDKPASRLREALYCEPPLLADPESGVLHWRNCGVPRAKEPLQVWNAADAIAQGFRRCEICF